MTTPTLSDRLSRLIRASGPICVAHYMAEANAHYYATRDPFGAAGDFVTAPEISQMFGELVGLCLADLWSRAGRPRAHFVELGPGRGTLAADALRAMRAAGLTPEIHLVETSPTLRAMQAARLPDARWHDDLATLPDDAPLLVVANEFFDALPVRQLVRGRSGWHERLIGWEDGRFVPKAGPLVPDRAIPAAVRDSAPGTVLETSPASAATVRMLAHRLVEAGGAAILVDYGHAATCAGETLQAVSRHAFADPFAEPGERDLTAHVDFEALGAAARDEGAAVFGPVGQGAWLFAMGIDVRTEALCRASPERCAEIGAARDRLISPRQMGTLFKVMGLAGRGWPAPAGLA